MRLKRFIIWLIEITAEAVLLSLFFFAWYGYNDPVERGFLFQLVLLTWAILTVFMLGSGYLITTAVLRIAWESQRLLTYSIISVVLVSAHLQIFFLMAGGLTGQGERLPIRVASVCIVFACTLVGGWILKKTTLGKQLP